MINLAIGLPAYNSHLDVGHAAMWLGLGAALVTAQDKFKLVTFSNYSINGVDLCRNVIIYNAIKAHADWVLMVDADTFHCSKGSNDVADAIGDAGVDILQMIRDAERQQITVGIDDDGTPITEGILPGLWRERINGIGLIGAPVRGRGGKQGICVINGELHGGYTVPSKQEPVTATTIMIPTHPLSLDQVRGQVRPVARIGGAFIGVNLNWLRQYWPKPPWFQMTHDYTDRPKNAIGEDYFFCDGIWKLGGAVLCDGRFVPEHVDRRRLVGEGEPTR